jgi:hypothetical protein
MAEAGPVGVVMTVVLVMCWIPARHRRYDRHGWGGQTGGGVDFSTLYFVGWAPMFGVLR